VVKKSDKKWASHMNTPHNANRPNQSNKQAFKEIYDEGNL
jgi:hypothetical protein